MVSLFRVGYHSNTIEKNITSCRNKVFEAVMILTCSECNAQYKLNPDNLGATGRTVRCVDCK
ncbi:MAG: zinc-ribbon domain-containing protein, partial [Alphaproteobacteria bacterium]|nr:zinc-ribbon domain-containing protein [Alphaproteobacteria bacterium]